MYGITLSLNMIYGKRKRRNLELNKYIKVLIE